MANATAITVRDLVANGSLADPTGDALDTGTIAVKLPCLLAGKTGRVVFRVTNTAVANLTVTAEAGDDPPAGRQGIGAFTSGNIAQNAVLWLGPFESARFVQQDGTAGRLDLTFTPASGTIACSVQCFRLPVA